MPFQAYQATVEAIRDLTHDVREIHLRLVEPKEMAFKAGQFISFDIVPPGATRPVVRPYSIASPPHQADRVTIVLNLVPEGAGSTYLFGLQVGDRVTFKGPAGSFYVRDRLKDLLFVATGTGIAPIRSMLLDLFHREYRGVAQLYWGLRSQRDLYYQEDFVALARTHSNFSTLTTLSQPSPGWDGTVGRVTSQVAARVRSVNNLAVYLCGNHGMIKDVTQLINQKGLCPVYREIYYDDPSHEPDY